MKRTIVDDKGKGFNQNAADIRKGYIDNDVRYRKDELSANFKKIINTDCYGVQKGVLK